MTKRYRIALLNEARRPCGWLAYREGKAQWPTGPAHLADTFSQEEAAAQEAGWQEALANKGTGYTVKAEAVE